MDPRGDEMAGSFRDFHIADILSVTHDYLISTRHMDAVYDVLSFVTGAEGLSTHQLGRAANEVKLKLFHQLPESVKQAFPDKDALKLFLDDVKAKYDDGNVPDGKPPLWLEEAIRILEDEHGQMISIQPVSGYQEDCPIEEGIDMVGPEKFLPLNLRKFFRLN